MRSCNSAGRVRRRAGDRDRSAGRATARNSSESRSSSCVPTRETFATSNFGIPNPSRSISSAIELSNDSAMPNASRSRLAFALVERGRRPTCGRVEVESGEVLVCRFVEPRHPRRRRRPDRAPCLQLVLERTGPGADVARPATRPRGRVAQHRSGRWRASRHRSARRRNRRRGGLRPARSRGDSRRRCRRSARRAASAGARASSRSTNFSVDPAVRGMCANKSGRLGSRKPGTGIDTRWVGHDGGRASRRDRQHRGDGWIGQRTGCDSRCSQRD